MKLCNIISLPCKHKYDMNAVDSIVAEVSVCAAAALQHFRSARLLALARTFS